MLHRRMVLIVVLATFVLSPLTARGDEVDGLKAAFTQEIAALNARDLDTVMAAQHPQVIVLNPASPSPIDGKAARRQGYEKLFDSMESFTLTPVDPQYRVLGSTGLVWGTYKIERKPKDGPAGTISIRYSRTYVKSGEKWLLAAYHVSPIPPGN